jgi:hypothetical protein
VLSPFGVDALGDQEGLLGSLARERPEDGVAEQVLDGDVRQVPGREGIVVLPELIGDLRDGGLGDEQLARGVPEGVLDISVDRSRAYVSVTRRSSTSEFLSKNPMRLERYGSPAPRTCGTPTRMVPSALLIRPGS